MIARCKHIADAGGAMLPVLPPSLEEQFTAFYRAAYADGELATGTKALIGLAVAMTTGCAP
jgi:alkylhydroperoxidase/carboxymuconolactone decarboxylase family protein YurZ